MKTKKLVAGFMAAITAATMASSIIVSAADFSVTVSTAKVKAGEEFKLTVNLADIPADGMNGCEFGIEYDSAIISDVKVTKGEMVKEVPSAEATVSDPLVTNTAAGKVSVIYGVGTVDKTYYLTGSGTFLNITGTVKDTAKAGDKSDFKIVAINRADSKSTYFGLIDADDKITAYKPTITDGLVEVIGDTDPTDEPTDGPTDKPTDGPTDKPTDGPTDKPTDPLPTEKLDKATLYGDVDLNKKVEVADVVRLNTFLITKDENSLGDTAEKILQAKSNADVDRNNKVEVKDSGMILDRIAEILTQDDLGKPQA